MRVSLSLSLSLFETLSDCLVYFLLFNICPSFWLYPLVLVTVGVSVGIGEIQLIVF